MSWINRILVPVDLSACSEAALRYAVFLSEHWGATLDVLYVFDSPRPPWLGSRDANNSDEMMQEDADQAPLPMQRHRVKMQIQSMLSAMASDAARHARIRLVADSPAEAIIRAASEQTYDLIVMGKYGEAGHKGRLAGRITAEVAERVPCSVVSVWEPGLAGALFALSATTGRDDHPAEAHRIWSALVPGRYRTETDRARPTDDLLADMLLRSTSTGRDTQAPDDTPLRSTGTPSSSLGGRQRH